MGDIKLPGIGTAGGWNGKMEDETLYYSFTNYHTPGVIYSYNPKTKNSDQFWKPDINFDPDNYISEQIFFTSLDGTPIPMIKPIEIPIRESAAICKK